MAGVLTGWKPWAVNRTDTVAGITTRAARQSIAALLGTTDMNTVRPGVIPAGRYGSGVQIPAAGLVFPSNPAAMSVTINPFGFVVPSAGDGTAYVGGIAAAGTLAVDAANATNPRIDLVVARIYDDEAGIGSQRASTVEVITGTAAAVAAAPALPAGSFEVARIAVAANAASIVAANITFPNFRYAVPVGGIRPVVSGAGLADVDYPGAYRDNGGVLERFDGTTWTPVASSLWVPWSPTLWAGTTAVALGTNGSVTAEYRVTQKEVQFRAHFQFGTGNVNGSGGDINIDFPAGVTGRPGSHMVDAYLISPAATFQGFGSVVPSESKIYVLMPTSISNGGYIRMHNTVNGVVNKSPNQPDGKFPVDEGGRLVLQGSFAIT